MDSISPLLPAQTASVPGQHSIRPTIPAVISQHAESSAALRHTRSLLVRAPHVRLRHLRRLDDRIAAHLDGLAIAGRDGWKLAAAALESPGAGEVFTCTVLAIQESNRAALEKLMALAEAHPPAVAGLVSGFGWISAPTLRGIASTMLASTDAFHRQLGLATCAMHRVDPGAALDAALNDADPRLRARALRVAGELGRADCLPACLAALADEDAACRHHGARSGALLGDRNASVAMLRSLALSPTPVPCDALRLLLKLTPAAQSHSVLKALSNDATRSRTLIQAVGVAGDPHYVPWLFKQMADPKLARLAGESFSLISGLDLADRNLEIEPPEGVEFGPSDDPEDDNVAMDEDESLPWPDPVKISAWWQANGHRFTPGTRYFIGEPPSPAHCLKVLKGGYQRQRIAAAQYLSLLQPGTPLFPTSAPAWRQQRWLDKMA
jgi:uncharacterized protein (TIGR02270 family)